MGLRGIPSVHAFMPLLDQGDLFLRAIVFSLEIHKLLNSLIVAH